MDSLFPFANRATATEAHRVLVRDWLRARPEFVSVDVGPLVDAWYGHD
ncbi:YggL family protein [Paraburkholderia sp. UCT2]|nr:YggL family protein [Paraburkholderia sp. UCT2]